MSKNTRGWRGRKLVWLDAYALLSSHFICVCVTFAQSDLRNARVVGLCNETCLLPLEGFVEQTWRSYFFSQKETLHACSTALAKQLLKSLRALVPSKELTNFTAAGRIGFKYIYRELPNLSDRLYIETDWQKIPQRERLPIPSRQGERRFTGSICSTRSEHSRRRTTECQTNSTHKMGEVVFLVERALQHHAASHLQKFYVSKVHKKWPTTSF